MSYRAGELVGREHGQDRQREPPADALDAGQRAEGVALCRRPEAEQGPRVLTHLQFGQDQHLTADRPDRVERAAAAMDLVADAANVDHHTVAGGFGEHSGEAGNHPVNA